MTTEYRRADVLAERLHAGQFRKGLPGAARIPYITHPRAVARILADEADISDIVTLQAALLHDTIEDCGVGYADLYREFGHEVAYTVMELTNDDTSPDGKLAMQIAHAKKMSARAALVKMADKVANLRDLTDNPPDWPTERRRQYFMDAREVVQAMPVRNPVMQKIFDQTFFDGLQKL